VLAPIIEKVDTFEKSRLNAPWRAGSISFWTTTKNRNPFILSELRFLLNF
jgi:hypothetical protein